MESIVEDKQVGAEVYKILTSVPKKQYEKVPLKIRKELEKYKLESENIKIKYNVSFVNQKISQKAKDIIFVIAFNCWLTDEEKRKSLANMKENEKVVLEKYGDENIFCNNFKDEKEEVIDKDEKVQLVKAEDKWYKHIFDRIKKIFEKNK